ncbi:MAG: Fe-Mn family superoxide dismutase, partial [Lysobacterales bacterium]
MATELPALPYAHDALQPHFSAAAVDQHRQHHQALANSLARLAAGTRFEAMALPDIVRQASGTLFNTAAEVWNHDFYWACLRPPADSASPGADSGALAEAIDEAFGSFDGLREQFTGLALSLFGSGWIWLVQRRNGALALVATANAGNPLTGTDTPLLACDVWEHA